MDIVLDTELKDADRDAVRNRLRAFNRQQTDFQGPFYQFGVLLRDPQTGETQGGLTGYLSFGWMFIELLFVPEHLRGQDLGTRLMAQAEQFARDNKAVGIFLDTFSFQARGFYEKLGYRVFGQIEDFPPGAQRFYLSKYL